MIQATINKIENAKNLSEYFNILQENFNCENCKPGRFIKATLCYTILNKIGPQGPEVTDKIKNLCLDTPNIKEFIEVLKQNFNCENIKITPGTIIKETKNLILLINLKDK
jgi:hypothetical protein